MTVSYMHKRRGYWYYIRRVPREAQPFENAAFVLKSTRIRIGDDPRGIVARVHIRDIDSAYEARWSDLIAGIDPDQRALYQRNVRIATEHRLPYLVKSQLAALPNEDLLHRLRLVEEKPSPELASALLGTINPPSIKLSQLLEEYCKLNAASLAQKSASQLQKWRVARESSIQVFMSVNHGDMELAKITRSHALAYRNHWNQQAVEGKIQIGSANKYIGRFSSLIKAVADAHQIAISPFFEKLYITGEKTGKRQSFDTGWVQTVLLAEGALDALNDEARAIIYLIAETGLRLVEACNLSQNTIKLDHNIPHIQVRPEGRQLKTDQSERDIPLVGVALMAMQQHPEGFPRYKDKNATASALINKFLRSHFKIEGAQTLYSLQSETGIYALIEFQIEQARKIVRPSPALLREYLLQRGLTRLPAIVVSAQGRLRTPANAFQAASSLPRQTVSAARAFSQAIEHDAREIAALKVKIRAEHIQTRKNIAGLAKIRINELRAEIRRAFQPHYKQARISPEPRSVLPQAPDPQRIDAIAQKVVLKATIKAHQMALRTRLKPALEEKRAALQRADELHARFERTDRALTASSIEDLQHQWRALASERMRQVHGPDAAPHQGDRKTDFLSRLASRAGDLRQQSPAPEQNRLPEPD